MRQRLLLGGLLGLVSVMMAAAPVASKGPVTATLDEMPPQPSAGEPVEIGFTLLMDGSHPVDWERPSITATNAATGETVEVQAAPEGRPGHYVATLTFPSEGTWNWAIETREIMVETKLQPLAVAPAPTPATAQPPAGVPLALVAAVVIGVLAALVIIGVGIARRTSRGGAVPAGEKEMRATG